MLPPYVSMRNMKYFFHKAPPIMELPVNSFIGSPSEGTVVQPGKLKVQQTFKEDVL